MPPPPADAVKQARFTGAWRESQYRGALELVGRVSRPGRAHGRAAAGPPRSALGHDASRGRRLPALRPHPPWPPPGTVRPRHRPRRQPRGESDAAHPDAADAPAGGRRLPGLGERRDRRASGRSLPTEHVAGRIAFPLRVAAAHRATGRDLLVRPQRPPGAIDPGSPVPSPSRRSSRPATTARCRSARGKSSSAPDRRSRSASGTASADVAARMTAPPRDTDVVVVGAGVIGLDRLAPAPARRRHARDRARGSRGGSIRASSPVCASSGHRGQLPARARVGELLPRGERAPRRAGGAPLSPCGYLFLAHSQQALAQLHANALVQAATGVPSRVVDAAEAGDSCPGSSSTRSSARPCATRTATSTARSRWWRRSPEAVVEIAEVVGLADGGDAWRLARGRRRGRGAHGRGRGGNRHTRAAAPARRRAADRGWKPLALPLRADPRTPARATRRLVRAPLRREAARKRPRLASDLRRSAVGCRRRHAGGARSPLDRRASCRSSSTSTSPS